MTKVSKKSAPIVCARAQNHPVPARNCSSPFLSISSAGTSYRSDTYAFGGARLIQTLNGRMT